MAAPDNSSITAQHMAERGAGFDLLDDKGDDYFDEPLQPTDGDCKCGGWFVFKEGLFECVACGAKPGE